MHIHGSRCKRVKKDEIDKKKGAIVIPAEEGDNMEQLFGVSVWRLWRGQVAFERCEGKGLGGREVGGGGLTRIVHFCCKHRRILFAQGVP